MALSFESDEYPDAINMADVGGGPLEELGDRDAFDRRREEFRALMHGSCVIELAHGFHMVPHESFDPEARHQTRYLTARQYTEGLRERVIYYSEPDHDVDHAPAYEKAHEVAAFGEMVQSGAEHSLELHRERYFTGKLDEFHNRHKHLWWGLSRDKNRPRILLHQVAQLAPRDHPLAEDFGIAGWGPSWHPVVDRMIIDLELED